MKQLCAISAPPDTYSGYGARSRDFIKAIHELKKDEWDIVIVSQRWGSTPWGFLDNNAEEWGWMKDLIIQGNQLPKQPDVWIQITVPNEFQPVGKVNIGVTAGIETTMCDAEFILGCNRMDVTLVSSKHAKQILEVTSFDERDKTTNAVIRSIRLNKPVEVLFEGADLNKYFFIEDEELEETDLVLDLDSIKEDFNYLYVGHWLQGDLGEDRKNTGLLVKLFLETFKDRKNQPALIMKTSHGGASIMDREEVLRKIDAIRDSVAGKNLPNIYLIHGDMDDEDINNLYNHPKVKAMINLTKGEGYGRPLAEFALSKKPIITTAWSGHTDFLSPEFSILLPGQLTPCHPSAFSKGLILEGASWFSVDNAAASRAMIDVYENYKKYADGGKRQGHKIKTEFNYDNMVLLLGTYFEKYVKIQAAPQLVLPKLNKVL
jgi:hypothetical protein